MSDPDAARQRRELGYDKVRGADFAPVSVMRRLIGFTLDHLPARWRAKITIASPPAFACVAQMAHRAIYARAFGPIPDGMLLDHRCCVRACVNPAHLEPVTPACNTRRGGAILFRPKCDA